ncbi:tryptophan-rich sensory protein [uncultured Aquimarina sp.]|uniref:tryptophan-rich sensory protein n=1 Tax=uncultured Aquimarina sp. TaxID=575652 RepID=UPI0026054869|nr:tryptophan-rich sensory protein [uncultured Aquimarina sp.]
MRSGRDILVGFRRRWRLMLWLEIALYALGPAMLIYLTFSSVLWTILTLLLVGSITAIVIKPWKKSLENIASYIDLHLDATEYSTGLLLVPEEKLSGLARIQQNRVATRLVDKLKTIKPPNHLVRGTIILSAFILIGLVIYKYELLSNLQGSQQSKETPEAIVFKPTDTTFAVIKSPKLIHQQLTITYPNYTQIPSLETSKMDIKAVEGSRVSWNIQFDQEIKSVMMESMGNSHPMKLINETFTGTSILASAGFYNFKFTDLQDRSYVSELYTIEVTKDKSPSVEIKGIKQFTSFSFDEDKKMFFTAAITDDFGIEDAYIIATVSKGSGESVKFREEKLNFNSKVSKGSKNMKLSKNIDLDQMKMEPGDELYFYVEALDRKKPKPNTSRSETFFAVIKDTISDTFAVEGTMGVDLMPDYFRSQRQLIIDTEKLLKDKGKLSIVDYKSRSNELGFDQKVLRLRYAEFMGGESESEGMEEGDEEPEHQHEGDHQEEGHEEEDPLAKYTHKHDSHNEHNLVEEKDEGKKDPLEEYLHNHEDPEASTLFTQSLKSKLREALNEMWDAELYLRLYTPEKSLPYQYRALKLIQEIKNSARIYVHRIGFDPPPIKEDKRLTGEIKEVSGYRKTETLEQEDAYPSIRVALARLEQLISEKSDITNRDKELFKQAGNELAAKAIEDPGQYLETLQQLKWISEDIEVPLEALVVLQKGLFLTLPELKPNAVKQQQQTSEINDLLLKELEIND